MRFASTALTHQRYTGPDHWPKRPHDVGGFCESIELSWYGGRKHVSDPPTGILPPAHREAQWRSSCRHIEPFKPIKDRGTGTKRVSHPIPTNGLGWTGTNSNFTGPRHFMHLTTSIEPCANTMTASYGVEKVMGMKKFVFSKDMGLEELYGEGERRCNRAATEWSLDKQLQRKIRVENCEYFRSEKCKLHLMYWPVGKLKQLL